MRRCSSYSVDSASTGKIDSSRWSHATVPIGLTARIVAESVPDARLIEYDDGAHGIFASHKERLIGDLLEFLDPGIAGENIRSAIPLNTTA